MLYFVKMYNNIIVLAIYKPFRDTFYFFILPAASYSYNIVFNGLFKIFMSYRNKY